MIRGLAVPLLLLFLRAASAGFAAAPRTGAPTATTNNPGWWCQAVIDYSAANEFIAAHYGLESRYFGRDRATEPILNAREGLMQLDDDDTSVVRTEPSLTNCGFQLVETSSPSNMIDWNDLKSIRESYLPVVREALASSYGDAIRRIYFWCPTIRRQDFKATPRDQSDKTTPLASYVATAHIDTDVNAYSSVEDLVQVVESSRFPGTKVPVSQTVRELQEGRRFAIVNAWRNIGANGAPIRRAPLAFMPMRYTQPSQAFPDGTPDFAKSRWYTFPEMATNEILLFAQYDRDAAFPSDLWHCALTKIGLEDSLLRESFDVRCLVLFDEQVPKERDRLARRKLSKMNFRESQTFCSEQAERRRQLANG